MKQFLPGYVFLLIVLLVITFISCEQTLAPEKIDIEENHLLPKQGNELIPHIESNINHTSQAAEKSNPNEPNWKRIEAAFRVLNILNSIDDSYYYAFISVKNKNGNGYRYKYIKFKPDEEAKSGAEDDMLYTYTETTSESDDINLFLLAQIPNTEMALKKVRSWFNPGTTEPSNNSENRLLMNSSQACSYEDEVFCFSTGDPDMPYTCWHIVIESCPSEELEEEDGSGGGGSYEPDCYGWDCEPIDPTGGGGGSYDPDDPNEDPTDTECPGEDEGEDHGQDEGNLTLDSTCSDEEEEEDEFFGDITIDESVRENSKANCVLDRLLNDGNTLSNTIVKFAEESVNLNLHIELADLGPADGDQYGNIINGNLVSSNLSNTFYLQLNENRIDNRTPIEIAATFLHEAIHAEMRRYLYGATDTSTLLGFPGDFAYDWILFLEINYGLDESGISDAEHESRAVKYHNVIVNGLKEFFDSNFTQSDYEAIAWIGLNETKYFNQVLTSDEQETIEDEIQNAKIKATSSCN